jgi:hypothetical protein
MGGGFDAGVRDAGSDLDAGPPDIDGGCVDDSQCSARDYCAGTGCGTPGDCEPRPTLCPQLCQFPEICGCDGQSYCNECDAEAAGTRADPDGCGPAQPDAGTTADGGDVCGNLTAEGEAIIAAMQTCSSNSDCLVENVPCGFGACFVPMSKTNSAELAPIIQQYDGDMCGAGTVCGCPVGPADAVCQSGVCAAQ